MADKTTLRWNYFTLEGICKAKCGLCDVHERPVINKQTLLSDHLKDKKTTKVHEKAIDDFKLAYSSGKFHLKDIDWDLYYDIVKSTDDNYILNPKVKCKSCKDVISIQGGTETKKVSFLIASPKMGSHLKDIHNVGEENWIYLNNWIADRTADYCNTTKSGAIRVYTCTKCDNDDNESRAKNAIMFARHMIDQHRDDEGFKDTFSWDEIPKELLPLYSTVREDTTLSSDIADRPSGQQDSSRKGVFSKSTQFSSKKEVSKEMPEEDTTLSSDIADRPGPSHQGSSRQGVFSESTPVSSKRKKVLKKMSKPAVSTQIKESSYKRRKSNGNSTDDSN